MGTLQLDLIHMVFFFAILALNFGRLDELD